ncbi:MAG: N-acetylmuramoyl-L-alanine amidase [Bacteroidota bacterium]|nr:N-acetylmuramoyl-L-alanine amidase [Bacteroidota bacterium]
MRKIFLILIVFSSVFNLFSQDFSDISICINPGHGGHDGDDRYIEETGFWESEGNLTKGLYIRDILESYGATIVMTRVTNNTSDDLPLSQICQIANENNVDFFHSIHSNGFSGVINYPLMLFRGYDNEPVFPAAKEMGHIMWQKLWDHGNGWTHQGEKNRGDWSFYPQWGTSGLGVLRDLTMPGVLSEGSFHDYVPESWRLKNLDYRRHEAWVFARSYFDYFETDTSSLGVVAGIVRDPYTTPGFYFDPNTLDKDIPLDSVTVTLTPGDLVYETDTLNNGYFFFDSIAPGDYVLTYTAEDFYTDTTHITVLANETSFLNKYLQIDTTIAPQVLYHSPVSTINDSIALNQVFTVYFDYPMNEDSVETAISISPDASLVFSWDEDSKILTISPETVYLANSHYSLTISTSAQHLWNVPISAPYNFDLYIKDRTQLVLENWYPKEGMEEISTLLQLRLYLDASLDASTIEDNIVLYDPSNNIIPVTRELIFEENGKGFYFFEPENELDLNSYYRLAVSENLADEYGTILNENYEINFKTITDAYIPGTVFIDFESISSWWDPDGSGSTIGTIDELTTFTQSSVHLINGTFSGRLDYAFENDNGGVCRTHNAGTPAVGSDPESKIGFWVFGDLSYNILEYWFYPPTGYSPVYVDTIDWAGWELKYIPFTDIGSGSTRFASLVVRQTEIGSRKGTMYFDDGQIFSPVGIDNNKQVETFIEQNYPNPFSTFTTFKFNVPDNYHVKLSVYNMMGQQVAILVDENSRSGSNNYVWDGTTNNGMKLNSGLYIYKFEMISLSDNSKNHIETGKCILME